MSVINKPLFSNNQKFGLMIVGQIDNIISDKLNQQRKQSKLNILGSSNGCIIQKNKSINYLLYLNAIIQDQCLCYFLNALCLQVGQSQLVIKKGLQFSTQIIQNNKQKSRGVDVVCIQMNRSPNNENIFAFKIIQSKTKMNLKTSIIALVDISNEILFQRQQKIPMFKIISRSSQIYDLKWHPNCVNSFLILGQNQQIQVWDLSQDISIPTDRINLKKLKKQAVIFKQTKFMSMFFCENGKSQQFLPDYFNLYLLTNQSQIYSLFPFLLNQITLPFNNQKVKQLLYVDASLDLVQALNSSQLTQNKKNQTIIYCQKIPQQFKLINWVINGQNNYSYQNKRRKEQFTYGMHILQINTNRIIFQFGKNKLSNQNFVKINLIVDSILPLGEIQKQNTIYPIAKINFAKSKNNLRFHQQINNNYVVISEGNIFYRLNIILLKKYLQTEQVKYLRKQKPFQVDCLFRVNNNENIQSLVINNDCLYMVRSGRKVIQFDINPLVSLGIYDKIDSLNRGSRIIIQKLSSLKINLKSQQDINKFSQINSLDLGEQKIKKYKEQGVKRLKIDYDRYCSQIKNKIDHQMNDLKLTYENLKNVMRKFKTQTDKKKKLQQLGNKIKQNNKILSQLLFPNQTKLQPSIQKQINTYDHQLQNLHGLVSFIKNKQLNVDQQILQNLQQSSQSLLKRLKIMQGNFKQISKMQKQIQKGQ